MTGTKSTNTFVSRALAGLICLGAAALPACSPGGGASSDPNVNGNANAGGCTQEQQIASWPLEQRVAQLLMGGVNTEGGEAAITSAKDAIAKDRVGGVNFLGSGSYAYDDGQLAEAVDAGGQIPPFLAVDEEGGRVQRLAEKTGYLPSAREMAANQSPEEVRKEAARIGRIMRKLSLNMDLAPVVDVSDQYADAVIGDRSFSGDPKTVTQYAGAFADGLRQSDIIPVLKHFPGLGSGTGNTDYIDAQTPPLQQLKKKDLKPYESLLLSEPVAVMTTNASVPGLTKGQPASLSPATYDLLRNEYGFDGVTMTDSLSAGAVTGNMEMPQAVVRALAAGADVALWDGVSEAVEVRKAIISAIRSGELSEQRINDSVRRVLTLKGVDLCAGR